jgi:hypothetical protein
MEVAPGRIDAARRIVVGGVGEDVTAAADQRTISARATPGRRQVDRYSHSAPNR